MSMNATTFSDSELKYLRQLGNKEGWEYQILAICEEGSPDFPPWRRGIKFSDCAGNKYATDLILKMAAFVLEHCTESGDQDE
jgi:hypothetical protein